MSLNRPLFTLLLPFLLATSLVRCASSPDVPLKDEPAQTSGGSGSGGRTQSTGGMPSVDVSPGGSAGEGGAGGAGEVAPVCGDGSLDPGEGCDDGNARPGDGCSGVCKLEPDYECPTPGEACVYTVVCGDSLITGGEACDDGNAASGDGCSRTCQVERGYACEVAGEPCTPTQGAECGNGRVEFGETCDDGELLTGDGCDADCQREDGFSCPKPGEPCVANEFCGDGRLTAGEVCDDGNTTIGDGCNGLCQVEPFSICPAPGQPCESTIVCGDLKVVADEACDDGNTVADDGCAADCKRVEPGYNCPTALGVGGPCTEAPTASCGDGRLDPGEFCDDGNTATTVDGCTANCTVLPGYDCPTEGMLCTLIELCGDGKVSLVLQEECDDGNTVGGDGCSVGCVVEANYDCQVAGRPCVSLVRCGDGVVLGSETCDDRNVVAGDGCSATCSVESGWTCPSGGACRATLCGDGLIAGSEQCDNGNAVSGDGCSSTCRLEPGWVCSGTPSACRRTVCGDNLVEGHEQCDGGNALPFDGCSPACTNEPNCTDAAGNRTACAAVCGDGIKFPSEACDDGNKNPGDGCSATCRVEAGFTCSVSGDLTELVLPAVFRDFTPATPPSNAPTPPAGKVAHGDFQWAGNLWGASNPQGTYWNAAANSANRINVPYNGLTSGLARATLGNGSDAAGGIALLGKPVFGYTTCPLSSTGAAGSDFLRRNGAYYCAPTVQSAQSFAQWFTDGTAATTIPSTLTLLRCPRAGVPLPDPVCVADDANTFLFDSNELLPDGTPCGAACDGFFPLDDQPGTQFNDCGAGSPDGNTDQHNFHFTSEVRYWFQYQAAAEATLSFRGDDDVFVFINGRLVVDIGGIHGALPGSVTLDAARGTSLGLVENGIYEIGVFQAERNTCASNYRLQLKNFALQASVCVPRCGDGVVTSGEACDDGTAQNTGAYGRCTADCRLGPRCGDGIKQANEACDNGLNTSTYATSPGACAPGCVLPPSCGDGRINGANGEDCDDGAANSNAYGSCTTSCKRGPRCGDGVVTHAESCDDGVNNGTSSSRCSATCSLKCGNGVVEAGEQCDLGAANNTGAYGRCTADCRFAPRCGDGIKQANEQCDDGKNDGSYGTCAPSCVFGPRCGDGALQSSAGEVCDRGTANVAPRDMPYGRNVCTTACQPAPYCGDSSVDPGEVCDDGVNSGLPGSCSPDCKDWVDLPSCGDGQQDAGEECDEGANNGTAGSGCDVRCRNSCGNGVKDEDEECDDGVNDGSFGTCNPDCTVAEFCGDGVKNGPEDCDLGAANRADAYGPDECTTACTTAPYCGDGRIQTSAGEECDSTSGCSVDCTSIIPK